MIKECIKCGNQFSTKTQINGKTINSTHRIQCFTCHPYIYKGGRGQSKSEVLCDECGVKFLKHTLEIGRRGSKHNYCSKECCHKARIKDTYECQNCKNQYQCVNGHKSKKYCHDCYILLKSESVRLKKLTINELLERRGVNLQIIHSEIRGKNRQWNKELTLLPCIVCEYTKHVELAHIKGVAAFPNTALLSEINAKDNSIPLCPNHHWEFDNDSLSEKEKAQVNEWLTIRKKMLQVSKMVFTFSKPIYPNIKSNSHS